MNRHFALSCVALLGLAACGEIPYRTAGYAPNPGCQALYEKYDDISELNKNVPPEVKSDPCWLRAREERDGYDLLFLEFDDQGWIQNSASLPRPSAKDALDEFFDQFKEIYQANRKNGLSVAVFVHGWHHDAQATDTNVTNFRRMLHTLTLAENGRKLSDTQPEKKGRRVVGIYIGWRGESIPTDALNWSTFWERKNTAERVAQGSIREFFMRLDFVRDRGRTNLDFDELRNKDRPGAGERNVRVLAIGHSFGGLITFESLSSELVRISTRNTDEEFVSRLGDLVVIVNPAVEGARYEPVMVAAQRLHGVNKRQLPVVIVATSTADWATGVAFPAARWVSTLLERTPGPEGDAIVKAVGHNERYTTHRLAVCEKGNAECAGACPGAAASGPPGPGRVSETQLAVEYRRVEPFVQNGIGAKEYLCGGLVLESTANHFPMANPFWVVSTTGDIMDGHNDIFNPNFVAFIRQMYLAVISARK